MQMYEWPGLTVQVSSVEPIGLNHYMFNATVTMTSGDTLTLNALRMHTAGPRAGHVGVMSKRDPDGRIIDSVKVPAFWFDDIRAAAYEAIAQSAQPERQ